MCNSPIPLMTNWPESGSVSTLNVGSSFCKLFNANSNPLCFDIEGASIEQKKTGSGILIPANNCSDLVFDFNYKKEMLKNIFR